MGSWHSLGSYGILGGVKTQYRAFLSYSHEQRKLAKALQKGLQRLGKPWYKTRAFRVFRDDASLQLSEHLWNEIEKALFRSEYFILIATPSAAESPWVRKEIAAWRSKCEDRKVRNFLIVWASGRMEWSDDATDFNWSATDALPAQELREAFSGVPHYARLGKELREAFSGETHHARLEDAETAGKELDLRDDNFAAVVAKVAAPLHGPDCKPEDLLGEEVTQQRRLLQVSWSVAAVLLTLSITAIVLGLEADNQRGIALGKQLVSQAELVADESGALVERSVLLALEAHLRAPSLEADRVLRRGASLLPEPVFHIQASEDLFVRAERASDFLVLGHGTGAVRVIASDSGVELSQWQEDARVRHLRPGAGRHLLVVLEEGPAQLRELPSGRRIATFGVPGRTVVDGNLDPSGRFVATASGDGQLMLWTVDGRLHSQVEIPSGAATEIHFNSEAQLLAFVSGQRLFVYRVGDLAEPLAVYEPASRWAFSTDGRRIAFESRQKIRVVEPGTGLEFRGPASHGVLGTPIFSADGTRIAVPGRDNTAILWDVERELEIARVSHGRFDRPQYIISGGNEEIVGWEQGGNNLISDVAFSSDSQWLATAGSDHTARVWDVRTGRELSRVSHGGGLRRVWFDATKRRLLSVTGDGEVRASSLVSYGNTSRVHSANNHVLPVFSGDGGTLASAKLDQVEVWATGSRSPRLLGAIALEADAAGLSLDDSGQTLAITTQFFGVCVWSVGDLRQLAHYPLRLSGTCHEPGAFVRPASRDGIRISQIALHPHEPWLVSTVQQNDRPEVVAWNFRSGESKAFGIMNGQPLDLIFSASGRFLIASSQEGLVAWEWTSGTKTVEWAGEPFGVSLDDVDRNLAFAEHPASVYVVSLATGQPLRHVSMAEEIIGLDLDPAGARFAVTQGTRVILFPAEGGPPTHTFSHDATVKRIDFHPSDPILATAGLARYASAWSLETGTETARIERSDGIQHIAFQPESDRLLTVTRGHCQIETVDSLRASHEACERLTRRSLTTDEWQDYLPTEAPRDTCNALAESWTAR